MSRYKDLAAIGLAVMLSFGLVACGGGGGGGSDPAAEVVTPDPDPDPDPAIAQRAAVEQAAATLRTATAGLSAEDVDQGDVNTAMLAATGLHDALTAATDVPDTETAGYASQLTAARSVISGAQARVTAAREAAEEEAARKVQLAKNAVSLKVAAAILAHDAEDTTDTPVEFRVPTGEGDEANITSLFEIERTSGIADITLQQTTEAATAKPYKTSVVSIDDEWSGMGYTHTNKRGTQMENAVLYTDIEMAGHLLWLTYFGSGGVGGTTLDEADLASGAVDLENPDSVDAQYLSASVLPGKPVTAQTTATRDLAANSITSGMFFGVSGKYTCGPALCTLTRDSDDDVTVTTGTLTFSPDVPEGKNFGAIAATTEVKYVDPDPDFMHFGYWMESTKQDDGSYKHEIRTLSGSNIDPYPAGTNFEALRGSATYSGLAAGRYVGKSGFDENGDATIVTDGEFVASANLKAQFGNDDGTVAAADLFAITGTIDKFMDDGVGLGWTLKLNKAPLGTRDPDAGTINANSHTSTFEGSTSGDDGARPGEWSGTMYGVDGGVEVIDGSDHPSSVAGEFNGHFVNGHVAGAFGARNDEED